MKNNQEETYRSNLQPKPVENRQTRQKSPDECGAIWTKVNQRGVEYLSIKYENDGEEIHLKAFLNSTKQSNQDNKPSHILYKSKGIKK